MSKPKPEQRQSRSISKALAIWSPTLGEYTAVGAEFLPDLRYSAYCKNFIYKKGRLEKRRGMEDYFVQLPASTDMEPNFFGAFYTNNRLRYFLCSTKHRLYRYNYSSTSWVDVTPGGADLSPLGVDSRIPNAATMFGNWYYTNGFSPIVVWDGATASMSYLTGTDVPDTCSFLMAFADRIFCIGTKETGVWYPRRIRWADFLTGDTFTGGSAGFKDADEDPYSITGAIALQDVGLIFKPTKIYTVTRVGYPTWFSILPTITGTGCVSPGTIQQVDNNLCVFMGDGGVYLTNGSTIKCITENYDWPSLIANTFASHRYKARSMYNSKAKIYYLWFIDQTTGCLNTGLRYDFNINAWSSLDIASTIEIATVGTYDYVSRVMSWAEATRTWASAGEPWRDEIAEIIDQQMILADTTGNFYRWGQQELVDSTDTLITAEWKSPVIHRPNDPCFFKNELQTITAYGDGEVEIGYGGNNSGIDISITYFPATDLDIYGGGRVDPSLLARFHQIALRAASTTTTCIISGLTPQLIERGEF